MEASQPSSCLIDIQGMRCQSCVRNIEGKISAKLGVCSIKVDLDKKEASVQYDGELVNPEQIAGFIDDMGFDAKVKPTISDNNIQPDVQGMSKLFFYKAAQLILIIKFLFTETPVKESKENDSLLNYNNKDSNNSSKTLSPNKNQMTANNHVVETQIKCYIQINGMTCASCVAAIEKHALKMKGKSRYAQTTDPVSNCFLMNNVLGACVIGVTKILVALMAGKAEVFYEQSKTSPQAICDWITSLGFPSSLQSNNGSAANGRLRENGTADVELHIGGMTCSSCVYNIESNVSKLGGILEARVALSTQKGLFTFDPDRIGPRQIIDHIVVRVFHAIVNPTFFIPNFFCLAEPGIRSVYGQSGR